MADTGVSCHVTYEDKHMTSITNNRNDKIVVGDQRKYKLEKKGDLNLLNEKKK